MPTVENIWSPSASEYFTHFVKNKQMDQNGQYFNNVDIILSALRMPITNKKFYTLKLFMFYKYSNIQKKTK